jgi:hypothetical protein
MGTHPCNFARGFPKEENGTLRGHRPSRDTPIDDASAVRLGFGSFGDSAISRLSHVLFYHSLGLSRIPTKKVIPNQRIFKETLLDAFQSGDCGV